MAEWHYTRNGQEQGPVSSDELKELAIHGELEPSDLVWQEGMPQWVAASQVPELGSLLS